MVGLLEPHGLRFATELARRGYTRSSVELHVRLAAHLSAWLDREDLGPGDLAPDVVERYFAARRAAGCASHRTSASLRPLLAYLRVVGVAPEPASAIESGPVEALLERYRRYLRVERCLAPVTIEGYVCRVRPFVERRVVGTELRLESLVAGDVVAFVLSERPRRSRGSVKLTVTALRSLLRFLHVDGCSRSRWCGRSRASRTGGWRGCRNRWSRARWALRMEGCGIELWPLKSSAG